MDTLVAGPLMPVLARLRAAVPRVVIDLRTGVGLADLRAREVDAALRAEGGPPASRVGRELGRIAVAVYRGAAAPPVGPDAFDGQGWVVPDEELGHLAPARWLSDRGIADRATLRVNGLHTLAVAVAHGRGLGVLPCYLADVEPRLARVGGTKPDLASDLWFLTHPELRRTARMRALSDHLAREMHALRPLFEGASRSSPEGAAG